MFSQNRRQLEGKGRWAAGLDPEGLPRGRGQTQFHKGNTFQHAECCPRSRGVFVMRNCVIFPSSSTFCGSPSPT